MAMALAWKRDASLAVDAQVWWFLKPFSIPHAEAKGPPEVTTWGGCSVHVSAWLLRTAVLCMLSATRRGYRSTRGASQCMAPAWLHTHCRFLAAENRAGYIWMPDSWGGRSVYMGLMYLTSLRQSAL